MLDLHPRFCLRSTNLDVCGLLGFPSGEFRPAVISRIGSKPEITLKAVILTANRWSLVLTAVAALSAAYPADANLIANGGFESGDFTGWTITLAENGSNLAVVPFNAHSGNYAASFGAFLADLDAISQTFPTVPGTVYHLSFWLSNGFDNNEFRVTLGGVVVLDLIDSGTIPYTQFNFTGLATGSSMTLEFAGRNSPSFTTLDDVSVTAVPDRGSAVSLLGFGLFGLAALRRKLHC